MTPKHIALTREQSRRVDAIAIEQHGMTGPQLMENAGSGAAELLQSLVVSGQVTICCGRGNNGGDGFVIARYLAKSNVAVKILLFTSPEELRGDALLNYEALQGLNIPIESIPQDVSCDELTNKILGSEWIVDALLGTGSQGTPRPPYMTAIQAINTAAAGGGVKVFAVDLPSGLDADAGEPFRNDQGRYGPCVKADVTATFVALKVGFERPAAREFTGDVFVIDIGIPPSILDQLIGESAS